MPQASRGPRTAARAARAFAPGARASGAWHTARPGSAEPAAPPTPGLNVQASERAAFAAESGTQRRARSGQGLAELNTSLMAGPLGHKGAIRASCCTARTSAA